MKRINPARKTGKPNFKNLDANNLKYVTRLEKEISKLQNEIVKLKVTNLSNGHKIKAMEKEIGKFDKNQIKGSTIIYLPYNGRGPSATHKQTKTGKFIKIK
jgi:uncharacterized protein (UPF0335 family)